MTAAPNADAITHDAENQRFELRVNGQRSEASYQLHGRSMHLVHTGVPPALQGHGIAARLVAAALDHARREGLRVRPVCSYVRAYMRRHPDTLDLLET